MIESMEILSSSISLIRVHIVLLLLADLIVFAQEELTVVFDSHFHYVTHLMFCFEKWIRKSNLELL